MEREYNEILEQYPNIGNDLEGRRFTMQELLDRASTFDIWKLPSLGALQDAVECVWIKIDDRTYRLSYPWADGTETLQVSRDLLQQWDVSTTLRPKPIQAKGPRGDSFYQMGAVRQATRGMGFPSDALALAAAEAFMRVERTSVMKLKSRLAPWKKRPASNGQLGYLRRINAQFKPSITMGEASDLIDLYNARKARR
jgi:hypothetical protein